MDRLQLLMVFKEKLIKKHGYELIYKKMVEDLKKLEEGIIVNIPEPKKVKFGLHLYAADNLEAHQLAGFSSCFSSKSVCRWCHIQYEQLDDHIHDYAGDKAHDKWTVREYDSIVGNLELNDTADDISDTVLAEDLFASDSDEDSDEDLGDTEDDDDEEDEGEEDDDIEEEIDNRGVKSKCPLNVLQSFHCVDGFPADLLHDHFEGVVPEDLLSVIRTLSSKGWFSLEGYNSKLKSFGWTSYETNDKPLGVPTTSKVAKLKGKACSQWVHIRNWPLLMRSFVGDRNDPVLALGLKLHEITERLTANEFQHYEIQLLKEAVLEYLDMRKEVRLEYPQFFKRPKPKHHFIREGFNKKSLKSYGIFPKGEGGLSDFHNFKKRKRIKMV